MSDFFSAAGASAPPSIASRMAGLNEPQRKAAQFAHGPLLVFAGAGSGKTRTLTFRVANLVENHRVPPYRILAVTFTNKAAAEMRERLTALVGEGIARDLWIGTFHGTAAKLLRRYHQEVGLAPGFSIYDDSDQKAVVARVIKDLGLDERIYVPKQVLGRISAHKRDGGDPLETDVGGGFDRGLSQIGRGYQEALARSNAVDFDDLLLLTLKVAENPDSRAGADLRSRFLHVLVDEFQDTNLVQYRIVRAMTAETRNLCVVGDDDQSIYRWRGADVRIIRGFRDDFPEAEVVKLEQNYRSSGNIVRAALSVIAPARTREPKELWTEADAGAKVVVRTCQSERDEAAFVASGIARARSVGENPREMAVFYRVHAQSRVLEEALRGANVPYQIIGGMRFFDRAEIKTMLSYLRLLDNPASDADFRRVVNTPARGIGDKTVERLGDFAAERALPMSQAIAFALADKEITGAAAPRLAAFDQLFSDLSAMKDKLSPADLLERVLDRTGFQKALREDDTAESDARLENVAELVGSIREYEAEAPETGEEVSLSGYLERVALVSPTDGIEDAPKVSLMTVHAAKGLEFETVFLTGMEEETFPQRGFDGTDPEELDEERRLAYVAITRAKRRLYVTHAGSRFLFGRTKYLAASRFLRDLPDDVVEKSGEAAPRPTGTYGNAWGPSGRGPALAFGQRPSQAAGDDAPPRRGWDARTEASLPKGPPLTRPGQRVVDRDAFDDVPGDEFSQATEDFDDAGSADEAPALPARIRPGQLVRHAKFGRGVVERVEAGSPPKVIARFAGYGTRPILAKFLQFE